MVAGAGEGHGEQHCIEAGEPVLVHVREDLRQPGGEDAVGIVQEQVARHQRHAGVDQRGHVAQAEDLRALDVEVLRQQHDGDAHNVHRDHQAQRQLQGVPHEAGHVACEEEADHREGVDVAAGVPGGEDLCQGVQAGQQHEPEEQVHEERRTEGLGQHLRLKPGRSG